MEIDRSGFRANYLSLNHCGVSPQHWAAVEASNAINEAHALGGSKGLDAAAIGLERFRSAGAELLKTKESNISFISNCATGLDAIARGYPFEPGDEIISYAYEYPSNRYCWEDLKSEGVNLKLLQGSLHEGRPLKWDLDELREAVTDRTKMVAVSHVQFVSGFSADLKELGAFCKDRNIDLVIDAAQSVGCMPVFPEEVGVDAIVASGWKWLFGPLGSGLMYTSPDFREKLGLATRGPDQMKQGSDYLNYSINPHEDGRKFEPSTLPMCVAGALGAAIEQVANRHSVEQIWKQIPELQKLFLSELDGKYLKVVPLASHERSGIVSCIVDGDPGKIVTILERDGIICTARGLGDKKFLRFAPHFHLTSLEMSRAAKAVNEAAKVAQSMDGSEA